jgi:hypothetical protein
VSIRRPPCGESNSAHGDWGAPNAYELFVGSRFGELVGSLTVPMVPAALDQPGQGL